MALRFKFVQQAVFKSLFPLLTLLLVILSFARAFAVIGPVEAAKRLPLDSVCRYIIHEPDGQLSLCTGSLVAPDQVLTAAHCLNPKWDFVKNPISVECGYRGFNESQKKIEKSEKGNPIFVSGSQFLESSRIQSLQFYPLQDQMILKLQHSLSTEPMVWRKYDAALATQCFIAGFGLTNQNPDQAAGQLISAKVTLPEPVDGSQLTITSWMKSTPRLKLQLDEFSYDQDVRDLIRLTDYSSLTTANAAPGDSGGPLLCQFKDGLFAQVGVLSTLNLTDTENNKQVKDGFFDWVWITYWSQKPTP